MVCKCSDFIQMDSQTGSPTIPQIVRDGLACGSLTTRQYPQAKYKKQPETSEGINMWVNICIVA